MVQNTDYKTGYMIIMKKTSMVLLMSLCVLCFSCSPKSADNTGTAAVQAGPMIGMALPDMTLAAYHNGVQKSLPLRTYVGKWLILFFYPADFSFVCPTELQELAEYYPAFQSLGAEIVSVSTDSVYVHRAWQKNTESLKDVRYPMVSDRAGKLCRYLRALNEDQGAAVRATFIFNPEGQIFAYEFHHDSIGRSADELLRKLNAAQAVREGSGGMCPAGWKPGEQMVHPK